MKLGILHLSDIHIENENDWILNKADKIAQAVISQTKGYPANTKSLRGSALILKTIFKNNLPRKYSSSLRQVTMTVIFPQTKKQGNRSSTPSLEIRPKSRKVTVFMTAVLPFKAPSFLLLKT
jgi:hypothetical protein